MSADDQATNNFSGASSISNSISTTATAQCMRNTEAEDPEVASIYSTDSSKASSVGQKSTRTAPASLPSRRRQKLDPQPAHRRDLLERTRSCFHGLVREDGRRNIFQSGPKSSSSLPSYQQHHTQQQYDQPRRLRMTKGFNRKILTREESTTKGDYDDSSTTTSQRSLYDSGSKSPRKQATRIAKKDQDMLVNGSNHSQRSCSSSVSSASERHKNIRRRALTLTKRPPSMVCLTSCLSGCMHHSKRDLIYDQSKHSEHMSPRRREIHVAKRNASHVASPMPRAIPNTKPIDPYHAIRLNADDDSNSDDDDDDDDDQNGDDYRSVSSATTNTDCVSAIPRAPRPIVIKRKSSFGDDKALESMLAEFENIMEYKSQSIVQ